MDDKTVNLHKDHDPTRCGVAAGVKYSLDNRRSVALSNEELDLLIKTIDDLIEGWLWGTIDIIDERKAIHDLESIRDRARRVRTYGGDR